MYYYNIQSDASVVTCIVCIGTAAVSWSVSCTTNFQAEEKVGPIDVLINSAGYSVAGKLEDLPLRDIQVCTVYFLIEARSLIDAQAPPATNIPHQIHTKYLIKHQKNFKEH